MIDALATAPQTISGFAEASRKTITFRVVKCECCNLLQKHSAERECAEAERRAGRRRRSRSDAQAPAREPHESELFSHWGRINLIYCHIYKMVRLAGLEPAILAFEARCPVQLNDSRVYGYDNEILLGRHPHPELHADGVQQVSAEPVGRLGVLDNQVLVRAVRAIAPVADVEAHEIRLVADLHDIRERFVVEGHWQGTRHGDIFRRTPP